MKFNIEWFLIFLTIGGFLSQQYIFVYLAVLLYVLVEVFINIFIMPLLLRDMVLKGMKPKKASKVS